MKGISKKMDQVSEVANFLRREVGLCMYMPDNSVIIILSWNSNFVQFLSFPHNHTSTPASPLLNEPLAGYLVIYIYLIMNT